MSFRCLSILAAVAQPATGIQSSLLNGEEANAGLAISVQMRQYSLLNSEVESAERLNLETLERPKPSNLAAGLSARRLGESASLTEEGYSSVASLRSKEAMEAFAERLLIEDGLKVKDVNMLRKVMPFYNGECAKQSMKALRTELHEATARHGCHAAWVSKTSSTGKKISLLEKPTPNVKPQHGDVAPLNQDGYLAVAALRSDDEMKKFIRRISKAEGLRVMNEGGLSGFARYYSGVCAVQSFKALVKELRSVQPVVKTTMISYELPQDADLDELQQRIASATGLEAVQIDVDAQEETGALDAASMKKALAAKLSVDEERVRVMKVDDAQQIAKAEVAAPVKPAVHAAAKDSSAPAKDDVYPRKATKTVVVTVTSADGVSVEHALKKLVSDSSKGMRIQREPMTMTASIPKPESCGGGWVAPNSSP